MRSVNGTSCAHECHCPTIGTEEKYVSEIIFARVKGINFARSQYPKPKMGSGEAFEVVEDEGLLVGNHCWRAVTAVIEQCSSRGDRLFYGSGCCGIGQTGCSRHAIVIIPVDFVDGEAFFPALRDSVANAFGIFCVFVGVSVVGHHHYSVLPGAGVFVLEVTLYFVYECFRFLFGGANHSSGRKIYFLRIDVLSFAIIKQCIEVVCHKAADCADTLR